DLWELNYFGMGYVRQLESFLAIAAHVLTLPNDDRSLLGIIKYMFQFVDMYSLVSLVLCMLAVILILTLIENVLKRRKFCRRQLSSNLTVSLATRQIMLNVMRNMIKAFEFVYMPLLGKISKYLTRSSLANRWYVRLVGILWIFTCWLMGQFFSGHILETLIN